MTKLLIVFALILGAATQATADLVSPNGGETAPNFAEISVLEDRVRVALEIDMADYPLFVAPEEGGTSSLAARTGHTVRVAADGVDLTPSTVSIDVRARPERITAASRLPVPPRPRSQQIVYAELDDPFTGQPGTITLVPPIDENGRARASIGLLAKHGDVPVTDYRYLSQTETMVLSWDDPWFTEFQNPNLTRHHKSPLMSFITVEPREVRHEVIVRLRDLEDWVDLRAGDAQALDPDALTQLERRVADFFADHNPVQIDGIDAAPRTVRVSPISVSAAGLSVLDRDRALKRQGLLLGVVLSYPVDALPQNVAMTWELFPDQVASVPVALTDPAGGVPGTVQPSDPAITWTNHLKTWKEPTSRPIRADSGTMNALPIVAAALLAIGGFAGLGAIGTRRGTRRALALTSAVAVALAVPAAAASRFYDRSPATSDEANIVMAQILDNISAAMFEIDDNGFDAALGPFVPPEYLDDVAAEITRGLSVVLPSGARAQTDEIADLVIEDVKEGAERGASAVLLRWVSTVSGGHWGHLHRRNVAFRALAEISIDDGAWQLIGLTVLSARPAA